MEVKGLTTRSQPQQQNSDDERRLKQPKEQSKARNSEAASVTLSGRTAPQSPAPAAQSKGEVAIVDEG